jgi:hypothetical protein
MKPPTEAAFSPQIFIPCLINQSGYSISSLAKVKEISSL